MKRIYGFAIISIMIIGFICMTVADSMLEKEAIVEEKNVLVNAFESSGAKFIEANVNTALHIPDTFWDIEDMEIIAKELIDDFDLSGTIKDISDQQQYDPYLIEKRNMDFKDTIFIEKVSQIGYNQFRVIARQKDGKFTVFILHSTNFDGNKQAHIIIDIVQNKGYKDIVEVSKRSKKILQKYGGSIETTLCFVGNYPQEMSKDENLKKIQDIAKFLKAKKVEEVIEESYISTTLYTPLIADSITYQQKTVNLHLAMRYNAYEDKTYLWLATPLITTTY